MVPGTQHPEAIKSRYILKSTCILPTPPPTHTKGIKTTSGPLSCFLALYLMPHVQGLAVPGQSRLHCPFLVLRTRCSCPELGAGVALLCTTQSASLYLWLPTPFPSPQTLRAAGEQGTAFWAAHPGGPAAVGRRPAHLVSLLLWGDPPMVDHLGREEVELDVRVGDPRLAPDEPTCFQMGCGSIP